MGKLSPELVRVSLSFQLAKAGMQGMSFTLALGKMKELQVSHWISFSQEGWESPCKEDALISSVTWRRLELPGSPAFLN